MGAAEKIESKQETRSLVRKLAEVMGEVERVAKRGRNEFHRYSYATEADIAATVRQAMAARHLMLVPSVQKTEFSEIASQKGAPQKLCTLTVEFRMMDGDSGEELAFTVIGQGQDAGDKASYKALTGAEKYALLKLFLIPTGDDPEQDSPERHASPAAKQGGSRTAQLKAQLQEKAKAEPEPAPAGDLTVGFGTFKGRLAREMAVLELSSAVSEGRAALEKNPSAKWAPKLLRNVDQLQVELDQRMNSQAGDADVPF
jgi:hypothetical protein